MHHGPELVVVIILCLALAVGALTRRLSQWSRFPFTVAMLVLGIVAGIALQTAHVDWPIAHLLSGGGAISPDLIIFVFLPALVFESAFALDVHAFRKNLGFVVVLAVPALIVSTVLTAGWMVGVTSEVAGIAGWSWSWGAALVFGALISATDPVAVVAILREVGAPKRLGLLIEGESLLNDGTAIVVFGVLIALLTGGTFDLGHTVVELLRVGGGGVLVGLLLGMGTAAWLARTYDDALVEITLTIVAAYAAMIVAESVLHVSGVLAIVTAGVYLAGPGRNRITPSVAHFLHQFWEMLAYIANTVIFFLVGFLIAAHLHLARPSTVAIILVGFVGLVLIRFAVTFLFRPVANRLVEQKVDARTAAVMSWGGLRGAVSLALALIVMQREDVPEELRVQILTVTAGIVLLTILVNGTTTGWLLRKLGFTRVGAAEALQEARVAERVLADVESRIDDADDDPALRTIPWQDVRAELAARRAEVATRLDEAIDAFEQAGSRARETALWRRALLVERRFYRHAYADGTLGSRALEGLELELDTQLDGIEADDLTPPASRLTAPGWAARIERLLRKLGAGLGQLAFRRLTMHYDQARVVAEAAERVRSELRQDRLDDPETTDAIVAVYGEYRREAKEVVEDLRLHLPEVAMAIEKRLARRIALDFERSSFGRLRKEGAIGESVAARTDADLRARAKRLYFGATRVELTETAELCRETALFADLEEEVIDELAAMTAEEAIPKGEWLFHEGDHGDSMYIVARGVVEVIDEASDESVALLGGGDLLGEMALLTGDPRTAGARAGTPVTVGRISRRDFRQLMETRPEVQEKIWNAFGRRVLDNRLRAGAMGEISPSMRRQLVAGAVGRTVADGESCVAGSGGAFVVSGQLRHAGRLYPTDHFVDPGVECVAEGAARLLDLPRPTMLPDEEGSASASP